MNYVESFDLFGIDAKQIPCIKGSGAPTTSTEGAVGCFYMNTDNGDVYKCTAAADGVYTWENAVELAVTTETEVMEFDTYIAEDVNPTTGEYTVSNLGAWSAKKLSTLSGGRSYITWDTNKLMGVAVRAFLFNSAGELRKVFCGSNGVVVNPYKTKGTGLPTGDLGEDAWLDVGTEAIFMYDVGPLSIPVPKDHYVRWDIGLYSAHVRYPDGTLTGTWSPEAENTNTWVYTWVKTGIEATVVTTNCPDGLVSYIPQNLTAEQKAQARKNIGAASNADIDKFDPTVYGLPVLALTGDTSAMTKENAVSLDYTYGGRSGTCTMKWQGSSSLNFPKKNYTVKFDNAFEAASGWGEENKYCLKANFIDHSHARNVVSAKLWGQIVKSREMKAQPFDMSKITHGSNSSTGHDTSSLTKTDDVITLTKVVYNHGYIFLVGNLYPAGSYMVTFDVLNPNTAETDPYNKVLVGMGTTERDAYGYGIELGEYGEWATYTARLHPTANGSAFAIAPYSTSIDYLHLNYQVRNIVITDINGNEFEVDPNQKLFPLVNGGAIDGFPCVITLNGDFHGLYTFNIPKDGWMFGMGDGTQEAILCADDYCDATYFRSEATLNGDFDLEYVTDEDNADWVLPSVNRMLNACINSDGTDLDTTVAQYLDWDSAIDYYIFRFLLNGVDMGAKNYILFTYDGVKWGFSAYDMDCVYGLDWDGKTFYAANLGVDGIAATAATLRISELIVNYKKDALINRYKQLRSGVMSDSNIAYMFTNFIGQIPTQLYLEDSKTWPSIPNTSVNNLNQIVSFYKERAKALDAVIESMASESAQ